MYSKKSNGPIGPILEVVSQASRIFPCPHARYGGGRGKGRKNTSGDYSTVFVSNGNVISAFGLATIT